MEHLSNDHKDRPSQHKNSHELCNEMANPVVNLMESQWKRDNNMIRLSQWSNAIVEQILVSEERCKSKRAGL